MCDHVLQTLKMDRSTNHVMDKWKAESWLFQRLMEQYSFNIVLESGKENKRNMNWNLHFFSEYGTETHLIDVKGQIG